jgi:hypothetical protein
LAIPDQARLMPVCQAYAQVLAAHGSWGGVRPTRDSRECGISFGRSYRRRTRDPVDRCICVSPHSVLPHCATGGASIPTVVINETGPQNIPEDALHHLPEAEAEAKGPVEKRGLANHPGFRGRYDR